MLTKEQKKLKDSCFTYIKSTEVPFVQGPSMQSMIWLNLLLISSTCTHGEVPQGLVALWGQEQQLSVMHNQPWQPCNKHAPSILTVYLPKGGKVESITLHKHWSNVMHWEHGLTSTENQSIPKGPRKGI